MRRVRDRKRERFAFFIFPAGNGPHPAAVEGRTLFIADGHHRYETALAYYESLHAHAAPPSGADAPDDAHAPAAHVMAFLAAFEDPGMVILPTHREIVRAGGASVDAFGRELEKRFKVERIAAPVGDAGALARLRAIPYAENAFVIALKGHRELWIIRRPVVHSTRGSVTEGLDVSVLHSVILGEALAAAGGSEPDVAYSPDALPLFARVHAGDADAAIFMRPMLAQQMEAACLAGELLPQKSTYFYPKLLTGLVFHALDGATHSVSSPK